MFKILVEKEGVYREKKWSWKELQQKTLKRGSYASWILKKTNKKPKIYHLWSQRSDSTQFYCQELFPMPKNFLPIMPCATKNSESLWNIYVGKYHNWFFSCFEFEKFL